MWVLVVVITTLTGGQSQTILSEWSTHKNCEVAAEQEKREEVNYASAFDDVMKVQYLCLKQDHAIEGYYLSP